MQLSKEQIERYQKESLFHNLVDSLFQLIMQKQMPLSDIREAALVASIMCAARERMNLFAMNGKNN